MSLFIKIIVTLIMINFLSGCALEEDRSLLNQNTEQSIDDVSTLVETSTPEAIVEPTATVEPIVKPIVDPKPIVEPEAIVEPTATVEPTVKPIVDPKPIVEPTPTVEPIVKPIVDPKPIVEPTATVEPIVKPIVEPKPIVKPEAIVEPTPTVEPKPIVKPEPVVEPVPTPEPITTSCIKGNAMQQGQIKDSMSNIGLKNVTISIDGCSTKTDENGFYTLYNIREKEKAIVNIVRENGYKSSVIIGIDTYSEETTQLSPNYLEYNIDNYIEQVTYSAKIERKITTLKKASIVLLPNTYKNLSGNKVYLNMYYKNLSKNKDNFPGNFEGKNYNDEIVSFISYAIMVVDAKDHQNNKLKLSDDATITFPSTVDRKEDVITLWYYNYNEGIWIEEGEALRQLDGSYKGNISHLGTWSLSREIENELAHYNGRIVYENNIPVRDARICAIGKNWKICDLSTDNDGMFELDIIPDSSFELNAYNYKWKYGAQYRTILPPIKAGDIVENRI